MTKSTWWFAALGAVVMAGCNGTRDDAAKTTPMAAPPTATPAQDASATANDAQNILGLKLPDIDKSHANWKFGTPQPDPFPVTFDPAKDYFATLHTTKGDITVKFFPEVAPKHVTSFLYLSIIDYYDNVPFHRVCRDFMMQGGDPAGQGNGGPAYRVPQEFNPRKHVKGILSAARTPDPNSAGSQFFLMFTSYPSLDNQYTVFGQVTEGMDIVDKFHSEVAVPQQVPGCRPQSLEKIKTVTVFTKDKSK